MELETPKLLTFIQHHFLDEVFSLLEGRSGARKQSQKVHPVGWTEPEPDGSVCHCSLGDGEELKQQRQSGSFRSRLSPSYAVAWGEEMSNKRSVLRAVAYYLHTVVTSRSEYQTDNRE